MDVQWIHDFLCLHPCDTRPLRTNHLHGLEKMDGFHDVLPDYICPFCYEEYDIAALCSHLEDEHSYETHPVGCPVCTAKVSRDIVGHITLQHRHLFKMQRRRNSCKAVTESNTSLPSPLLDDVSKQNAASNGTPSDDPTLALEQASEGTPEGFRQKPQMKALQAKFVQDLLLSLAFSDS